GVRATHSGEPPGKRRPGPDFDPAAGDGGYTAPLRPRLAPPHLEATQPQARFPAETAKDGKRTAFRRKTVRSAELFYPPCRLRVKVGRARGRPAVVAEHLRQLGPQPQRPQVPLLALHHHVEGAHRLRPPH